MGDTIPQFDTTCNSDEVLNDAISRALTLCVQVFLNYINIFSWIHSYSTPPVGAKLLLELQRVRRS